MLGKPWDPGNLGSACSSTVGVPGTQVPSHSLVSCRRVCSAHHSVVDSHQPFGSPWQAAGCPLPLAKPCASPQPSYYSIFQICMNNPLNFSISLFSQILCGHHGSWLSSGERDIHFRPEKKLDLFYFCNSVSESNKIYFPLSPANQGASSFMLLVAYVPRSLYPMSARTTLAKME